jgi:2-keto-4-pentenoate hydratase/2-oxohepta-3-ene-1,7-dioic acid hydratase in catechol pathway
MAGAIPDGQFALGTFAADGRAFAGLVLPGDRVADLSGRFGSVRDLVERWDEAQEGLAELAADPGGTLDLAALDVRPPVEPRQILQSGANYHRHVVELAVDNRIGLREGQTLEELRAETAQMMRERAETGEPYVFQGAVSALCGAYDDVVLPPRGEQHDWELELACVIGRRGRYVPRERALDWVAGYTICNDLTTRDLFARADMKVIGSDWVRCKNAPTFLPTGPFLVPRRFVPDPQDLRIRLELNGQVMQDESTADMIFDVAQLVAYASSLVELLPGDLLLTGSPAGNGTHYGRFLAEGDVMEASITGLGMQRNRCRREALVPQEVTA